MLSLSPRGEVAIDFVAVALGLLAAIFCFSGATKILRPVPYGDGHGSVWFDTPGRVRQRAGLQGLSSSVLE